MSILTTYRRKRALRQAQRGLAMLNAALHDKHLTRPERRRVLRECQSGRLDPSTLLAEGSE